MESGTTIQASQLPLIVYNTWGKNLTLPGTAGLLWISGSFGTYAHVGNSLYIVWCRNAEGIAPTSRGISSTSAVTFDPGGYSSDKNGNITTTSTGSITAFGK